MNAGSVLLWGFVATVTLTTLLTAAQGFGLSRMSIPLLLGTIFTPSRDRAMAIGAAVHVVNGWLFAFLYAAGFESLGRATWWLGAAGGALHGAFVLMTLLPLMPAFHPRMVSESFGPTANRQLQPPGFMALNYGRATPLVTALAHIAYGAILGWSYPLG